MMKEIIAENKKYVRAVIRKFFGADNEDIEQEVYIKTWQNLPKYNEQGKFKQWICALTANLCKDYFRSKSYKEDALNVNAEKALENASVCPHQEERLDAKSRRKIILKAVDDLPKIYRQVVVFSEFEEYSAEEIAAKLKIPVGTVKSRLHHARQILKNNLTFLLGEKI